MKTTPTTTLWECSEGQGGARAAIELLDRIKWEKYAREIMRIEEESYEPARRDSRQFFARTIRAPRGVSLVSLRGEQVVGFAFAGPLELFPEVQGAQTDPEWGKFSTLYSADVTVAAPYRGQGIGFQLKKRQTEQARALGYRFVAGRNRVALASAMMRITAAFGAYQVQYFDNGYGSGVEPGGSVYYHIDLDPGAGVGPGAGRDSRERQPWQKPNR